jgi:hypothetical protein
VDDSTRGAGDSSRLRRTLGLLAVLVVLVGGCGLGRPSAPPATFGPDVGLADFWVNPRSLPLKPDAKSINAVIREQACANGASPRGRVVGPHIEYGTDAITVTFGVQKSPGDCPSNPPFEITIFLAEEIGNRRILDGGSTPPRDAMVEPAP